MDTDEEKGIIVVVPGLGVLGTATVIFVADLARCHEIAHIVQHCNRDVNHFASMLQRIIDYNRVATAVTDADRQIVFAHVRELLSNTTRVLNGQQLTMQTFAAYRDVVTKLESRYVGLQCYINPDPRTAGPAKSIIGDVLQHYSNDSPFIPRSGFYIERPNVHALHELADQARLTVSSYRVGFTVSTPTVIPQGLQNVHGIYTGQNLAHEVADQKISTVNDFIEKEFRNVLTKVEETHATLKQHYRSVPRYISYKLFKRQAAKYMAVSAIPIAGWALDLHMVYAGVEAMKDEPIHYQPTESYFLRPGDVVENSRLIVDPNSYQSFASRIAFLKRLYEHDIPRDQATLAALDPSLRHSEVGESLAQSLRQYKATWEKLSRELNLGVGQSYSVMYDGPQLIRKEFKIQLGQHDVPHMVDVVDETVANTNFRKVSADEINVIYTDMKNLQLLYQDVVSAEQVYKQWLSDRSAHHVSTGAAIPGRMSRSSIQARQKNGHKEALAQAKRNYMEAVQAFGFKHRLVMSEGMLWIKNQLFQGMIQTHQLKTWTDHQGLPCYDIMPELRLTADSKQQVVDSQTISTSGPGPLCAEIAPGVWVIDIGHDGQQAIGPSWEVKMPNDKSRSAMPSLHFRTPLEYVSLSNMDVHHGHNQEWGAPLGIQGSSGNLIGQAVFKP